ncbi:hypothetical protein RFI_08889 [Reticulomyxa filosa]|uniref:SGNH hydrolase-type esterase domain-containing protein n=1 Tax=Reticulomyxa filosa TaxID=46433 RepID=X6NQE3_RETFI|nr:hypothetical protein RFI_08889 [Reticulomyxa filosa]|eukprot:ETO28241.1 hypothetical protein RFI_08889 [Reticulomyxa filosa]
MRQTKYFYLRVYCCKSFKVICFCVIPIGFIGVAHMKKKKGNMLHFCLASLALVGALGGKVSAEKPPYLLVAGDSWGAYGGTPLQEVLTQHGSNLTVKNYAIGGTTTTFWARDPNILSQLVDDNPGTEYIWLSLGGNDVLDYMPTCTLDYPVDQCINMLLPEVIANTRKILDPLFLNHPEVQVIQFGYDIINFAKNALCKLIGFDEVRACFDRPECMMSPPPFFLKKKKKKICLNPQMVKIQYLYVDNMTSYYPESQYFAANMLGSLQASEDIPGSSLEHPNLDYWSPADLIMDNCIHPTIDGGFPVIFNNLWDQVFA